MLTVPGTKVRYKVDPKDGPLVSWDGGETWHFTFRTPSQFREMWPAAVGDAEPVDNEDRERELFGETLDDPIPDDLWDMLTAV